MSLSREEFAGVVEEQLRTLGETRPVTFDAVRARLVVGDGSGLTHFIGLEHAYQAYLEAPASTGHRGVVARIWSVPQVETSAPSAKQRLLRGVVPRIRDRAWFSAVRRQAELELGADEDAIDELMLPFEALNDELAVHLAYELPTSVMEIGPDRLEAWGVSFQALYSRALENLRERSQLPFEEPEPGVFISPYHDTLDASRMVLTERFAALSVKGRPVAIAPTHDVVLVTGDQDESGLVQVSTWCEEAILEPHVNSAIAFRLDEAGRWSPWLPPQGHPAWAKMKLLQLQTYASVYSRQKEVLSALLEANRHEIAVVALRVFRTTGGDIVTSCAWAEGRESLLPKTDRVEFVRLPADGTLRQATTWSAPWELVQRLAGHLMQTTGDVPERYRVSEFPDAALLEQLNAEGKP